MDNVLATA